MTIMSIADSTEPRLIGSDATRGWSYGIWASGLAEATFVGCHWEGLQIYDTRNTSQPVRDTFLLGFDQSVDVYIDNGRAYVANEMSGLKILDVNNPAKPTTLGSYDTTWQRPFISSVVARDSFAFVDWYAVPVFRVMDVNVPSRPVMLGGVDVFNPPEDMVLRDSFVYVAEMNRFQIINVARPREPVLVGSCVLQEDAYGLCVVDSLAYAASYPFAVVNVSQPTNPVVVGSIWRGAWNGTVRDTFLFLSSGGILVYSVARPDQPRLLDSISVGPNTYWVEAVGTLLYTGNRDGVRVVDAADIHDMRVRGFCSAPYTVDRLTYKSPYVYAACWEAGVSIYESTQVAVSEPTKGGGAYTELSVRPNPVTTDAVLSVSGESPGTVTVRDIAGRVVRCATTRRTSCEVVLNTAAIPPGVYFVESKTGATSVRLKFVKQ